MARKLIRSKKAYVFTMIAILLVTLMLAYVGAKYRVKLTERTSVQGTRINQITNLVVDMENRYLPTAVIGVSQDVLDAMAKATRASGPFDREEFISEFGKAMKEGITFTKGDLTGEIEDTLPQFLNKFGGKLNEVYGIIFTYEIGDIDIYHNDPWWVYSRVQINYKISDAHTGLIYERNADILANFSIVNLLDPLYEINDAEMNIIQKSMFIEGSELTAENVKELILERYYMADSDKDAPSFLERFTGGDTGSPSPLDCDDGCGIVSFLNPAGFSPAPSDASYADYTFREWGGTCQDKLLFTFTDIPEFRLNNHFRKNILKMNDGSQYRKVSDETSPTPSLVCVPT